jgi:uncharacterized protein YerC
MNAEGTPMRKQQGLQQRLLDLLEKDFDGCEWFIISSNELMATLNETIAMLKDAETSFDTIKDSIGKIGIGIGNVERCLEGVEDFYNKTVEMLCDELPKHKKTH